MVITIDCVAARQFLTMPVIVILPPTFIVVGVTPTVTKSQVFVASVAAIVELST